MIRCYNIIVEEDEDPRNIEIKEAKGNHEVNGTKMRFMI